MVRSQIGAYLSVNTQFMTALRRLQGALIERCQLFGSILRRFPGGLGGVGLLIQAFGIVLGLLCCLAEQGGKELLFG